MTRVRQILTAFLILCFALWIGIWIHGAYHEHRIRSVTADLPTCDRVEVSYLHVPNRAHPSEHSPWINVKARQVRPFGKNVTTLDTRTFSSFEAERFADLWRALSLDLAPGARLRGHSPGYGLRFYSRDKLLFETTVCFQCASFQMDGLTGTDYIDFNLKAETSRELQRRLWDIFPTSAPAEEQWRGLLNPPLLAR